MSKGPAPVPVGDTPEWGKLTENQKLFLASYAWTRDAEQAATNIGKSMRWVSDNKKDNPNFLALMEQGAATPLDVGSSLMDSMVPMSAIHLWSLINQSENKNIQLSAIKHLHNISGISRSETEGFSGNFLSVNVKMFGKVDGKVIDVNEE